MADIVMIFLGKEIGFGRSVAWWMEKKVSEEKIGEQYKVNKVLHYMDQLISKGIQDKRNTYRFKQ